MTPRPEFELDWDLPDRESTVDEMITWLREKERNGYRFGDISAWRTQTNYERTWCDVWLVQDDRYDVHCCAPTLKEALYKAVRLVDDPARPPSLEETP